MIEQRNEIPHLILAAKVRKGLSWSTIADALGQSKEWATAACLGQMALDANQARTVAELFELPEDAAAWLRTVPHKAADNLASDPLVYRLYEVIHVYGGAMKELIHEEFGDGIMSAIDFDMDIQRQDDPKGDRVRIVMTGKFLPYKRY
ncbi:Cyanate hydratase family protein [Alloalcanivorax dieselolei B5]|uniref:Cyanate hydratase n=1 Tax=Alcanivorax dieselolei (strain DSM 16502 / CGMCC 1.3690 / MCCC 1A00001 / B-5) TaxID=930169 RepID=K0CEN7_ALCDB|nr:cyanase [Alloalcanivorax dieselolei]AFT71108.1 Cyanate hydratase family protein [Alloalcanivorax dieselolei B5]GGJ99996.1 cyanate hydratase [Alloalcanivorax dieselolei]